MTSIAEAYYRPDPSPPICPCGNPVPQARNRPGLHRGLCAHCALTDESRMVQTLYFARDADHAAVVYDIIESIRSACSHFRDEDLWLLKATKDIHRYITTNARCDDPLRELTRIKDDLWELTP